MALPIFMTDLLATLRADNNNDGTCTTTSIVTIVDDNYPMSSKPISSSDGGSHSLTSPKPVSLRRKRVSSLNNRWLGCEVTHQQKSNSFLLVVPKRTTNQDDMSIQKEEALQDESLLLSPTTVQDSIENWDKTIPPSQIKRFVTEALNVVSGQADDDNAISTKLYDHPLLIPKRLDSPRPSFEIPRQRRQFPYFPYNNDVDKLTNAKKRRHQGSDTDSTLFRDPTRIYEALDENSCSLPVDCHGMPSKQC